MQELKRLRKERDWSQVRLAKESGVDRATINQVEGGKRSPTIETLEKLATAMGAEVADFFPKTQGALFPLEGWGALPESRMESGWTHEHVELKYVSEKYGAGVAALSELEEHREELSPWVRERLDKIADMFSGSAERRSVAPGA